MSKAIWMKVTNDKYELPLVIADSSRELAKKLGLSKDSVSSAISKAKRRGTKSQYVKVELEE